MFFQTKFDNIMLVANLLRYVDYKAEDNKTLLYSLPNELTNGYIACILSDRTFLLFLVVFLVVVFFFLTWWL